MIENRAPAYTLRLPKYIRARKIHPPIKMHPWGSLAACKLFTHPATAATQPTHQPTIQPFDLEMQANAFGNASKHRRKCKQLYLELPANAFRNASKCMEGFVDGSLEGHDDGDGDDGEGDDDHDADSQKRQQSHSQGHNLNDDARTTAATTTKTKTAATAAQAGSMLGSCMLQSCRGIVVRFVRG